jgi:hypothetical protein
MTAYEFVIGFIAIITVAILWIGLNEAIVLIADILNAGVSDAATLERNVMAVSIFFYSLFAVIIAIGINVLKTVHEDRGGTV